MKKKIFVMFFAVVVTALLVMPTFAVPSKGNKVPVTIYFTSTGTVKTSEIITGNVIHRTVDVGYDITIDVNGVPTYTGTAVGFRNALVIPREVGVDLILKDDYVFTIDGQDGTFEGQAVIVIKNYVFPTESSPPYYVRAKTHALLQGTEDFEGQTMNVGHHWVPFGPVVWTGYLLEK